MPVCTGCALDLPEDSFAWKLKGLRRSKRCKSCQKVAKDKHYRKNRQAYIDKARRHLNEVVIAWIRNYKETNPCTDCGLRFHYCQMDFDHLRDKEFQIAGSTRYRGLNQIKKEIAKCELVCSNCHRLRTFLRRLEADDL